MKHRFEEMHTRTSSRNLWISILCFLVIFGAFYMGISSVNQGTSNEEAQTLSQAVHSGIIHCYSLEGRYPENLQYLIDHYGLHYDEDRFYIDYRVLGTNMVPDVTIIERED